MESIELARQFASRFGVRPAIFSAPGRVNLIGEHTDYNEGFVMPSAIGLCTRVAISRRQDRQLFIQSEQFPGHSVFDLDDLPQRSTGAWCDYVLGVAVVLQQAGHSLQGANYYFSLTTKATRLRTLSPVLRACRVELTSLHWRF
jgi:galactokinase